MFTTKFWSKHCIYSSEERSPCSQTVNRELKSFQGVLSTAKKLTQINYTEPQEHKAKAGALNRCQDGHPRG